MHGIVASIEWPTPALARLVLNGDGLAGYEQVPYTDSYVNVAIPPAGASYAAPFALDDLRSLPREQRPFRRRITVRRWEPASRQLTLDFVAHGDSGAAGPWAASAREGDALVFTGPAGAYRPDPAADWHLMVGDESALPAIAASLEAVPPGAPVVVRLVCDGPEHELALTTPGRLDVGLATSHRRSRRSPSCSRTPWRRWRSLRAGLTSSCTAKPARPEPSAGTCSPTAAWTPSSCPARRTGTVA